jgi:hypothetical protein
MKFCWLVPVVVLVLGCDHEKDSSGAPSRGPKVHDGAVRTGRNVLDAKPPLTGGGDGLPQAVKTFDDVSGTLRQLEGMVPGRQRMELAKQVFSTVDPNDLHRMIPWIDSNFEDDEFEAVFTALFRRADWSSLKDFNRLFEAVESSRLETLKRFGVLSVGAAMAANLGMEKAAVDIRINFANNPGLLAGALSAIAGTSRNPEVLEFLVNHPDVPIPDDTIKSAGMFIGADDDLRKRALAEGQAGRINPKVAEGAFFSWVRDDPIAASEWMNGLDAGSYKDSMIEVTCDYLVSSRKQDEARRWAATITDDDLRINVSYMIEFSTKGD